MIYLLASHYESKDESWIFADTDEELVQMAKDLGVEDKRHETKWLAYYSLEGPTDNIAHALVDEVKVTDCPVKLFEYLERTVKHKG